MVQPVRRGLPLGCGAVVALVLYGALLLTGAIAPESLAGHAGALLTCWLGAFAVFLVLEMRAHTQAVRNFERGRLGPRGPGDLPPPGSSTPGPAS